MMSKIGRLLFLILLFLWFSGCAPDRTIEYIGEEDKSTYQKFLLLESQHQMQIANEAEPGERLHLCLKFKNAANQQILEEHFVYLYHTSTKGEYEPSNPLDESTARLRGTAATDPEGRIFASTILPGAYGSDDNRHIHTTVSGAKPDGYDIHFKQYSTFMFNLFSGSNDQLFFADLKRLENGDLVTFVTILPKMMTKE